MAKSKLFAVSLIPAYRTNGGTIIEFCAFDEIRKTKIEATSAPEIIEKAKAWAAEVGERSRYISISCLAGRKPAGFDRLLSRSIYHDLMLEAEYMAAKEAAKQTAAA